MRINKFVALASSLSRRQADTAIAAGRVQVNGAVPEVGQEVSDSDAVTLDNLPITPAVKATLMLNKPVGYVCSRDGQGSQTIYDLLPPEYQHLNPVGRLDKNSSGLLLLTNDGDLAQELTHPSREKQKVYEVTLDKPLAPLHQQTISDFGVMLEDGISKFQVEKLTADSQQLRASLHEGRNRQIRRTFAALGYDVKRLHRTYFGHYDLGDLASGQFSRV